MDWNYPSGQRPHTVKDPITAAKNSGKPTIIELTGNASLTSASSISIPASAVIKLTSAGNGKYTINGNQYMAAVIRIAYGGTLWLENVVITGSNNNIAFGYYGGGAFNQGTLVLLDGCEIRGNYATRGGGVWNFNSASAAAPLMVMKGGVITQNNAQAGGGVYNTSTVSFATTPHFIMEGGEISENNAIAGSAVDDAGIGGGIVLNYGRVTMTGGIVTRNTAAIRGGGVDSYYAKDVLTVTGGEISNNSSGGCGGGLRLHNGAYSLSDVKIIDNHAATHGGGICVYETPLVISGNTIIQGNTSKTYGGGIGGSPASLSITGTSRLTDNIAGTDGGGIGFANPATQYIQNVSIDKDVVFSDNKAATAYEISDGDKALYESLIKTDHITQPFEYAYNNYDIHYTTVEPPMNVPAVAHFSATVITRPENAPPHEEPFEFGVFDENDTYIHAISEPDGSITFPSVFLQDDGEHHFTMRQIIPDPPEKGWAYDESIHPITVTVTHDANGKAYTDVRYQQTSGRVFRDDNEPPVFINNYAAIVEPVPTEPGDVSTQAVITAYAFLCANAADTDIISFGLYDMNGILVDETSDTVAGKARFLLEFYAPGIYEFTVRLLRPAGSSRKSYYVRITVNENATGGLSADTQYPKGRPQFYSKRRHNPFRREAR